MKTFRFFALPTILGWMAAFATCVVLHFGSQWVNDSLPRGATLESEVRGYFGALIVGGMLLVVPTYLLIIFPLSIADIRSSMRYGFGISGRIYLGALLGVGLVVTCIAAIRGMLDFGWGTRSSILRACLFYTPFIAYAIVISKAAKRLLPDRAP